MLDPTGHRRQKLSSIEEYAGRLGTAVRRHLAHAALIEARRRAEEAALLEREARVEAEAASRAKSFFLANMSHELRTPLNAIIGFAEIIGEQQEGPVTPPAYADYAREISSSGRHLLALINDLLDLTRIEAGAMTLNETSVDLDRLVSSCLAMLREQARRAGVTLRKPGLRAIPVIRADERKLRQILINLVSNAIKFTPENGTIRIEAEIGDDGIRITVADDGIGIPETQIKDVFQPFFQAENGLSRPYEGAGLGLPLSKALIELHGGRFLLSSTLGAGTTATLILPAERIAGAVPSEP